MQALIKLLSQVKDQSLALLPHVAADADAVGSALALKLILEALGFKQVDLILEEEPAQSFSFLLQAQDYVLSELVANYYLAQREKREFKAKPKTKYDLALAIDCREIDRLGSRKYLFLEAQHRAVIDHHRGEGEIAPVSLIDPQAASTAELMLDLIEALGQEFKQKLLNQRIATSLMTAIYGDTNRLSYDNTRPQTYLACALLMQEGVDLNLITKNLFEQISEKQAALAGFVLTKMKFYPELGLRIALVDQAKIRELELSPHDFTGLSAQMLSIDETQIAVLAREQKDAKLRLSIRSKGEIKALDLAQSFNGGGHFKAAGALLDLKLADCEAAIVAAVKQIKAR